MARDWNGDGKVDSRDKYLDYMIYQEVSKDSEQRTSYSGDGAEPGAVIFGMGLLILGVFMLFMVMTM